MVNMPGSHYVAVNHIKQVYLFFHLFFTTISHCVSDTLKMSMIQDGHQAGSRFDGIKHHSRTWWPESKSIPPVISVILLRAGVAAEVMCRELV